MRHTADYTFGLGIAQKFLAVVTLIGLIASILYAGRAANAARNSANALPRLERAYVTLTFECTAGKTTKGEIDIWRFTTVFQFENLGKPPAVVKQINFSTPVAEDKNMIPDYDELLNDWEIIIKSRGIHPDRKYKRPIASPKNYFKRERFYRNRIERDISLEELRHILAGEKVEVILGRVVYADIFGIEWETGLCHILMARKKLFHNMAEINIISAFEGTSYCRCENCRNCRA